MFKNTFTRATNRPRADNCNCLERTDEKFQGNLSRRDACNACICGLPVKASGSFRSRRAHCPLRERFAFCRCKQFWRRKVREGHKARLCALSSGCPIPSVPLSDRPFFILVAGNSDDWLVKRDTSASRRRRGCLDYASTILISPPSGTISPF